jgi:hypothetical protein
VCCSGLPPSFITPPPPTPPHPVCSCRPTAGRDVSRLLFAALRQSPLIREMHSWTATRGTRQSAAGQSRRMQAAWQALPTWCFLLALETLFENSMRLIAEIESCRPASPRMWRSEQAGHQLTPSPRPFALRCGQHLKPALAPLPFQVMMNGVIPIASLEKILHTGESNLMVRTNLSCRIRTAAARSGPAHIRSRMRLATSRSHTTEKEKLREVGPQCTDTRNIFLRQLAAARARARPHEEA